MVETALLNLTNLLFIGLVLTTIITFALIIALVVIMSKIKTKIHSSLLVECIFKYNQTGNHFCGSLFQINYITF